MNGPRDVARAIDAVRRGWPIAIDGLTLLAIETADDDGLVAFDPGGSAGLVIGAGRAATLGLANQRAAAAEPDAPVEITRAPWIDLARATAIADPSLDLATPLKGPFHAIAPAAPIAAAAALRLARIAGVLPAFFLGGTGAEIDIDAAAIDAHEDAGRLRIATRARLPVAGAEDAEIVAFRTPEGGDAHVALVIGQPDGTPPLVRLHSECLTGDVFGSLKCDCGPQLDAAIAAVRADGWGIVLYLRQEGRGIGLFNKLRAYRLQDQGFDTVDANSRLGLAIDARDFGIAAAVLAQLGQRRVRLMTNNPAKVATLAAHGIDIAERVPHALPANAHNAAYLATKRDRSGHHL